MKEKRRNYDFQYITRCIKRRERGSLRLLHVKDKNNIAVKIMTNRYDIEKAIIEYNRKYFQ